MTHPAVQAYYEAEKAANATPVGADCKAILIAVAESHGIDAKELRGMILDETIPMGAG